MTEGKDVGLETALGTPMFEKDLLTPSEEALTAITQSYFPDKNELLKACQYVSILEALGLEDEKKRALYAINGNRAIGARSLRYSVQAHGKVYWPDDTSKDEKKYLADQFKYRSREPDYEKEKIE